MDSALAQGKVNNESAAAYVRADATIIACAGEVHVQLSSQKQGVKGQEGEQKVRYIASLVCWTWLLIYKLAAAAHAMFAAADLAPMLCPMHNNTQG